MFKHLEETLGEGLGHFERIPEEEVETEAPPASEHTLAETGAGTLPSAGGRSSRFRGSVAERLRRRSEVTGTSSVASTVDASSVVPTIDDGGNDADGEVPHLSEEEWAYCNEGMDSNQFYLTHPVLWDEERKAE